MKIIEQLVQEGIAPYDAGVTYKIEIIKTNFQPGSGDYQDPSEIKNDQYGTFYKVRYTSLDEFKSEGNYYSSLDEAKKWTETLIKGVQWI